MNAFKALAAERSLKRSLVVKCLQAGWLWPIDLTLVTNVYCPIVESFPSIHAAAARRLKDKNAAAAFEALGARAQSSRELHVWLREAANAQAKPEPRLPSFARLFQRQCAAAVDRLDSPASVLGFIYGLESFVETLQPALVAGMQKGIKKFLSYLESPTPEKVIISAMCHQTLESLRRIPPVPAEMPWAALSRAALTSLEELGASLGVGVAGGLEAALAAVRELLDDLYRAIRMGRLGDTFDRIQAGKSLASRGPACVAMNPGIGEQICVYDTPAQDRRGVRFTVDAYPCTAETFQPRIVRIPPGKSNSLHKHAHDTLFMFLKEHARIRVGDSFVEMGAGNAVFCPRWGMHQTTNMASDEFIHLALTDYYWTHLVYIGSYDEI